MKKFSILSAMLGLGFIGAASAADITVYYSPTCPHCHHAREFIQETLVYEYPNLNVRNVNVMENMDMFRAALAKCEYESGGVPVLVVGDKCFQGYADFMQQELRDAVEVDLADADKNAAAENREAMKNDADGFKTSHADRANAVTEYSAAQDDTAQKKNNSGASSAWFYGLLIALVAVLGFVLIKKDNKKK